MSKLAKMVAVVMAAMMVSGVAMAEGKKKDAGPSAKETVEFINGLLACALDRTPVMTPNNIVFYASGSKHSSLKFVNSEQGELTELTVNEFMVTNSNSTIMIREGNAWSASATIPWGQLEVIDSPHGKDVELRCAPNHSSCVSRLSRHVRKNTSDAHSISYGEDGACNEGCSLQAQNELSNKKATPSNSNSYNINFCREEDAARSVKAINHLIQMNGGKKSLF